MITRLVVLSLSLLVTALGCVVVPYAGIRALMPSLERVAPKVTNYRGSQITHGLGVVALLWAAGALAAGALQTLVGTAMDLWVPDLWTIRRLIDMTAWRSFAPAAVVLVLAAFGFGLVDDLFGDKGDRGFRGHLGAMMKGRLTTGGLKLLGIGATAAFVAATGMGSYPGAGMEGEVALWSIITRVAGAWILATMVIALSANLVNLADLRPGRALKLYVPLAVVGALAIQVPALLVGLGVTPNYVLSLPRESWIEGAFAVVAALLFALGPALAAWKPDLGERSMLGDAGANSLGALAGYLLARGLPLWGLAIAAAILLALNLLSEKVSFSAIIERNAVLRWFDGLGRLREGESGPTAARGGEAG